MSILKRLTGAGPLVLALLLAGCGGAGTPPVTQSVQAAQGSAVETPPQAVDTAAFIKLAQDDASCADVRNRLWLIDGKEVFWDRAGSKCPDNSWSQKLYGLTPQALLCSASDSIAGPVVTCANDTARALFDTASKFSETPNLGLDASHKVEAIPFLPPAGTGIGYATLVKSFSSGIKDTQNVVIRDQAAWQKLWSAHVANLGQAPAAPMIDFSRQMVVGVFAGENKLGCGSDFGIAGITAQDGKVVVDYEERVFPRPEICLTMVNEPMQLALVDLAASPVEFVKHTVDLLQATTIDDTKQSGVHAARDAVVKDPASWAALWAEHAGKGRQLPAVDFGKQMVVGVFLGDLYSPCYKLHIDSVTATRSQVTVRYTVVPPPIGMMCTANVATMAQLIAIDRSDLPVVVVRDAVLPMAGMQ
jgi:hypothetical protein